MQVYLKKKVLQIITIFLVTLEIFQRDYVFLGYKDRFQGFDGNVSAWQKFYLEGRKFLPQKVVGRFIMFFSIFYPFKDT